MRALHETLLSTDYDLELCLGDLYKFEMDPNNPSPSSCGGYAELGTEFWKDKNCWLKQQNELGTSKALLSYRSGQIMHALIASILEQPVDFEINQKNIDAIVAKINKYTKKPRIEVHLKPQIRGKFMLVVFNMSNAGKFMGKIYLIPNK